MRRTMILAVSLILVGVWSQDSARGQTTPPVSLAPPQASPPPAGTKNYRPEPDPALVTTPPRESPPPVISGFPPSPNPAADYDGFSVGAEDNDTPAQTAPSTRPRAARSHSSSGELFDREEEALKRKLTICKDCK